VRQPPATMESRWTDVGRLRLHTRVSASPVRPDAPAVVLVHGMVISSAYMVPTAERLGRFCRVWAPDLPGFGESDKPAHVLTVPELAVALADWMDAVGLDRAAFLANSMGCQVVAHLAVRDPERVDRAILVGPTMDPAAPALLPQAARWLRDVPREPRSLDLLMIRDALLAGPRRTILTIRHGLEDRIEQQLPRMRVPTLVVRGGRDSIVPQRWAEEATRLLPMGRLVVIPGAGHAVNYNSPAELARVVRPFLTGHPCGHEPRPAHELAAAIPSAGSTAPGPS
jgi:2-hydroxy-6-oxonona-2,4-dienedioate hydrolase